MIWGKIGVMQTSRPVIDLGFQLRIRVDSEPLLKQQTFHQDQRGISLVSFGAFTDRIVSQEQIFDSGPIHNGVDLFHSFDGPVAFQRRKKRDIGEGEVGFHFLECHRSSRRVNLKKIWQKNGQKSSDNNITSVCYL